MYYYEVAPNRIIRADTSTLTYAYPRPLEIGTLVEVPVASHLLSGVIMSASTKPSYETREIARVLYDQPLPLPLVQTAEWLSEYYATPLATVWQTILPRGIVKRRRASVKNTSVHHRERTNYVFNKNQQDAIEAINAAEPDTFLLHGVTGSGKTRVYIETAKKAVSENKSVIVLVPEIALTSQLIAEFQNEFSDILVTHSRQTEAERHLVWERALSTETPVIAIGPRSALFLPLPHLGLVVVDECHEPSYKQEQSPRYSALTTAKRLATAHSAKLLLGSATPLVSDYFLAESTGRRILSLPERANPEVIAPTVSLVDMTKRGNFTTHRFFSNTLLESIKHSLENNEQVLIFHNRRGSASVTLCENCGWQAGCPRCFVPLTLHADKHLLICHICNYTSNVPTSCPVCGSVDIIHKGIGTKLIETELTKLFPNKKITRFDGDSEKNSSVEALYGELYSGKIDIIIGTQVVAKGLDLPHLGVVGVVQGDAGLSLPDYSAAERTFQLLAQVVGRVGRSTKPTQIVVQSFQPNHIAIKDGIAQNYRDFYNHTIALREHTGFPPFNFLLKLVCSYKTEATAIKNAKKLALDIKDQNPALDILGPTPAFYERARDNYRWQIVIRSKKRSELLAVVRTLPPKGWQFELDPISLL